MSNSIPDKPIDSTTVQPQINPLQAKTPTQKRKESGPVEKVKEIAKTPMEELSTTSTTTTINQNITSVQSQSKLKTSEGVSLAFDAFFDDEGENRGKEKLDAPSNLNAVVEKVFNAIMMAQPTQEASEKDEVEDNKEIDLKREIEGALENLTSENPEHRLIIGEHEFHFSLKVDIQDAHQIEIYQKVEDLGQGAFGKVSLFKNLDTGRLYASKRAFPRGGKSLREAEVDYKKAEDLVKSAKNQLDNAEGDEAIAAAQTKLEEAKNQLGKAKEFLKKAEDAESDIKSEIENLKLYNNNSKKHVDGIQPICFKVSSNIGTSYFAEVGNSDYDLRIKIGEAFAEKSREQASFNEKIVDSLCAGLNYIIQEKGMCHADIKPQNVMWIGGGDLLIDDDFRIYHADFGGDRPLDDLVAILSDPTDTASIPKLLGSSGAYTSRKIINQIEDLRLQIHKKVAMQVDVSEDQLAMRNLLIHSCQFGLGLTLFFICTNEEPDVDAFSFLNKGLLFGDIYGNPNFGLDKGYQAELQAVYGQVIDLQEYDNDTASVCMTLMGLERDFIINDQNEVVLI